MVALVGIAVTVAVASSLARTPQYEASIKILVGQQRGDGCWGTPAGSSTPSGSATLLSSKVVSWL